MRKILAACGLLLLASLQAASAQSLNLIKVTSCGTASYSVPYLTVDATGTLCTAASVSASISGFAPATTGTPISATTGGVTGTLPAGAVVVATNVGTTNGAYCKLGASSTTSDQYIAPNGGWFAFTVGANTQLTCITSTSTTTVNMVGGAGLPTGAAGSGGSGGGGGAVTIADGADVTQGALADAAASAGGTGSTSAKLRLMTTQLGTINTTLGSPFQAGGSIGNTSFGATQSGTWNITNISGTVSLPTGAATATNQTAAAAAKGEGATGAAVPSGAQYMGINSGGNLTGWNGAVSQSGTWNINNVSGTVSLPTGAATSANQTGPNTASVTNPTSTLTLPSATTAYTAGQLMATSATAGSVVNPSFAIANSAGAARITRLRLSTNDTTSTGWPSAQIQVDLWSTTPTWTNGDRGTWLPATGAAAHLGAFSCTMGAVWGDGVAGECYPVVGNDVAVKLASGTSIFWSLQAVNGSGVTGASKVFTLAAEVTN